jgi:hypothetical protein
MGFFSRFKGPAQVTVTATLTPKALSASELEDVSLVVTLTNASKRPVTVYPEAARFDAEAGWVGPFWRLTLRAGDGTVPNPLVAIRTWYGPPGHPPSASHWDYRKVVLAPDLRVETRLPGCWIPRALLTPEQLDLRDLDPEGMDGLANTLLAQPEVRFIVLGRDRARIEKDQKAQSDFLRPGLLLCFPRAGTYGLSLAYDQQPTSFYPAEPVAGSASAPLELVVP